jgi:hypothetical protein
MPKITFHLLILFALSVLISSCASDVTELPDPEPPHSVKGISFSPRSFSSEDFTHFFELVDDAGYYLTWAGDWMDLADSTSAATITCLLADQYNYEPIILTSWFNTSTGAPLHDMTQENILLFVHDVKAFAARFHPPIMVLGLELNTAYDYSEPYYSDFVGAFAQIRDSIRSVSPNTMVGVDFLWETMLGYHGGLFGGNNDTTNTQFELLDDFPSADFIGFNSYPSLVFAHPDSIPANHYSRIATLTSKPVAFFECGWHTSTTIPGWESSQAEQSRFVTRFLDDISPLEPIAVIWPFLFDQQVQEPFSTMGLWERVANTPKSAWTVWKDAEL